MEDNNSIIEVNSDNEDTLYDNDKLIVESEETQEQIVVKPPKKKRKLSKKGVFLILTIVVLILAIIGIVVYLVFFMNKNDNKEPEKEKIIIQQDNFIYEDGILKLKDSLGKEVGTYECIDKDIEKCYVEYFSNEDDDNVDIAKYYDEEGNKIKFRSPVIENKFVFIHDDDEVKLYDIVNKEVKNTYKLIKSADTYTSSIYVVAKDKNDKYGLVYISNEKIENALDFKYEYLGLTHHSSFYIYNDGKYSYIINTKGEKMTNPLKGTIKNFSQFDEYIALYNKNYELYDFKGTKLLSDLDYISFYNGYIITIKNSKMFIFDKNLNKVNEEGISIESKDYETKYIFDKNNNFKESVKPYDVDAGDGFITISQNNGIYSKTFNTYDAIINNRYDYVSYLDGKLYIYSNKEKTTLIGTYKCNNINDTRSAEDNFNNCFIAKTSNIVNENPENYFIPIISNKYIVVNDSKDKDSYKINIYDIVAKEYATPSMTNYKNVDFNNSDANITVIDTLKNLLVIEHSNGSFGVSSLDKNGLNNIIKFTDSSSGGATKKISLFKNKYYLVVRDKNYLYSETGNIIDSSNYEIIDYVQNKLVVKNNNYYMIYSNGTILSNDYVYVKLFDNYFVGIDKNNKLNVYNYSNTGLLSSSLDVVMTNDYENSYSILSNKNENGIIIENIIRINNTDDTYTEYKYTSSWGDAE